MKKNNFKRILAMLLALALVFSFAGCGGSETSTETGTDTSEEARTMGTVVGDYVIELPTITEIDFDKGLENFEAEFSKYGCTAVGKVLDNGDMVIGRSYDLSYSFSPAYIVRTEIPGLLKTVGVSYNGFNGATFDDVKENGLTEDELLKVYCLTGDVLNEKGFYIEANMRSSQPEETGIKECSGTNPDADIRLSFATLIRYLGERASTVDEALELASEVDVYGFKTDQYDWNGGFFLADATGHYGVLELIDNKLVWNDMQQAHANFYISPEYKDRATIGAGMGRYDVVMEGIDAVESEADMRELIEKVRYLQTLWPDTCQFDPVAEFAGTEIDGKTYYIKDVLDESNRDILMDYAYSYVYTDREKSLDEKREANDVWLSAYQSVVNCNNKTLSVKFFEDDELLYDLSVE